MAAVAYGFEFDGIEYVITSENSAKVTNRTKSGRPESEWYYSDSCITIPETVYFNGKNYTVTEIGQAAFEGCDSIEKIILPNSIIEIAPWAFDGCTNLRDITLSTNLSRIGMYAFSQCSNLASLIIQSPSITSIDEFAFFGCTKLGRIAMNSNAGSFSLYKEYDTHSHQGKIKIGIIYFPVESSIIEDGIIYGKDKMSIIYFPVDSIKEVTYEFPEQVTSIGESAFSGCNHIETLKFPKYLSSIGDYAFSGCSALKEIHLPKYLNELGPSAFYGCNAIDKIYYPVTTPKEFSSSPFSVYDTATLYVTEEAYATIHEVRPWNNFKYIFPYDFTGLDEKAIDNPTGEGVRYYDLNGRPINTSGAPSGIYIRRDGNQTQKVILK